MAMKKRMSLLYAFVLFTVAPVSAHANVGTALMHAGMLHLFILNAFIGVLEGIVLARVFQVSRGRARWWMIVANYVSMIAGVCLVVPAWTWLGRLVPGQVPLYKAPLMIAVMLVASWLATVLIEWPFCAGAMWRARRGFATTLRASLITQTASYALLVPFYYIVSPISLYREASIQRNLAFVRPPIATVFYIDPRDGAVWRVRTDGTGKRKVRELGVRDPDTRLYAARTEPSSDGDLWIALDDRGADWTRYRLDMPVLDHVGTGCGTSRGGTTWSSFGGAADLRPEKNRALIAMIYFWAGQGLYVECGEERYSVALETPFVQWICRSATVLPGDQVVFQLGYGKESQIVIIDARSRKLGFLTMGQGPVVVMNAN
jgi:hypothetical protein